MPIPTVFNGQVFNLPLYGEQNWSPAVDTYLQAISTGTLQRVGGNFALLADVNFGSTYGVVSKYYKSNSTNIATDGEVRLSNTDSIQFRNAANTDNISLHVEGDVLYFGDVPIGVVSDTLAALTDVNLSSPTNDQVLAYDFGTSKWVNLSLAAVAYSGSWNDITDTPTTLAGYGITDAQPVNSNLTEISGLTGDGFAYRNNDGTWELSDTPYTLPIASDTTLGGVKVGSGLSIDGTGVLSVDDVTETEIVNGTSSVSIPVADDNIEIVAGGNSVASFTPTGTVIASPLDINEAPAESGTIVINGITVDYSQRINSIGIDDFVELALHRHSTIIEPILLGIRSNSNNTSHANVTNWQSLFSIYGGGWCGSQYNTFGRIEFAAAGTGTISNTSAPGVLNFYVTAESSITPTLAATLSNAGVLSAATFSGALSGNASTATALQTSRTLWGQSFNGSANVTGNLTSVGNITGTGAVTLTATSGTLGLAATGANGITLSTNSTERMRLTATGNLLIGTTTDNGGVLQVNGTAWIFGNILRVGPAVPTPGNGGNIRFHDDTGTSRWLTGILGSAGAKDYSIRDIVGGVDRVYIPFATGNVLIGTTTDDGTNKLQVSGNGIRIVTAQTPASASATGVQGTICWDSNYVYVCVATNTWKRTALSTW